MLASGTRMERINQGVKCAIKLRHNSGICDKIVREAILPSGISLAFAKLQTARLHVLNDRCFRFQKFKRKSEASLFVVDRSMFCLSVDNNHNRKVFIKNQTSTYYRQ